MRLTFFFLGYLLYFDKHVFLYKMSCSHFTVIMLAEILKAVSLEFIGITNFMVYHIHNAQNDYLRLNVYCNPLIGHIASQNSSTCFAVEILSKHLFITLQSLIWCFFVIVTRRCLQFICFTVC